MRGATTAAAEAALEPDHARAAFLPRIDVSESWQRGNQPVFVFSSLLSQRRFSEANFAIDALNHPDAVTNVRSAVSAEQVIYDGALAPALHAAHLGAEAAAANRSRVERDIAVAATEAYGRALLFDALAGVADGSTRAAEQDLAGTRDRRDAGLATDADVLTIDVHLAQTRERAISARAEASIARARLNQLMGEPLDRSFVLDPGIDAADASEPVDVLQAQAVATRPEVRLATINRSLADTAIDTARAAWLPQIALRGGWEGNGGTIADQVSSWGGRRGSAAERVPWVRRPGAPGAGEARRHPPRHGARTGRDIRKLDVGLPPARGSKRPSNASASRRPSSRRRASASASPATVTRRDSNR